MSVAEQIFAKAQVLPEPAQKSVLEFVERLSAQNGAVPKPKATFGSAKNLTHIAPDFHDPLGFARQKRVQLPLIDSKEAGILDLNNADIEELLA